MSAVVVFLIALGLVVAALTVAVVTRAVADVRIAKWTGVDPRVDRDAAKPAPTRGARS